jgi:hypothetical protein
VGTTPRQRGFRVAGLKLCAVKTILGKVKLSARAGSLGLILFNNLASYDTFPVTRLAARLGIPTIQGYEDERFEGLGAGRRGWPNEFLRGIPGRRTGGAKTVASFMKRALENPDWRRKLGQGAREAALTHCDLPVVQRIIAVPSKGPAITVPLER